jgi:transposase
MMMPLVRRSWAPRGKTPFLYQRTLSHRKVSAIAVLCVSPARDRLHLFFRLHPNANINGELVLEFLKHLSRQFHSPMILIWDRFLPHRAKIVQSFIKKSPKFHMIFFPPYAPELNPVENVWGYLKHNSLVNDAVYDLTSLANRARNRTRALQCKQYLLRSFLKHSPLFLRLK